ncbi:LVIVD repeat-containing protein [Siphonobacter aquaeclarae]|jgi:hypothetical protein|uniref:Uncharacterized conserved protein n=1 Tax=Siphonobacter aquaeclarae TaxID=563176 RepID=A0A1G9MCX7_9BACT|nr:hypothetical protein [Siphonobacter aquaeclarae]MBO9637460.1 hypothetical protein [Siphonobacter aquaeclarae]SDL71767.1 Uncharacterized conserved protein [Siphonobacter aquaeclarae]
MKKQLLFLLMAVCGLTSCEDNCQQTQVSRRLNPFQIPLAQLRAAGSVNVREAMELEKPGKIYVRGNVLFINEIKKGVHIIDNTDPKNPRNLSFIEILGNADIAVKGNVLYADSYTDFLVFDISQPTQPKLLNRVENAFTSGMVEGVNWYSDLYNPQGASTITDYTVTLETTVVETDCDGGTGWRGGPVFMDFMSLGAYSQNSGSPGNQGSGKAGSMARFAIVDNILYAVTNQNMQLFDISAPASPNKGKSVSLGWGIETIFPYEDRLYVGSTTGVQIFSNADPTNPIRVSTLSHARACDPVVVHGNYAYVTLRAGESTCGTSQNNQLDLIDVTSMYSPKLVKTFSMQNPYGLGINYPTLFVCEGNYGLKSFDVSDPLQLDKKMLNHFKGMNAFDVIPLSNKLLMLVGRDGFYQYDYSDRNNPQLLSRIPVRRKDI